MTTCTTCDDVRLGDSRSPKQPEEPSSSRAFWPIVRRTAAILFGIAAFFLSVKYVPAADNNLARAFAKIDDAKSGSLPKEAFTAPNKLELHEVVQDSSRPELVAEPRGKPVGGH